MSQTQKPAVKAIRKYLAAIGHPISQVQGYEVLARASGLKNKHVLAQGSAPAASPASSEALALVERMRKELRAYANPQGFGTIWYIADSTHEATEWATQYLARGARSVKIAPHADGSGACDVLIVLARDQAEQVLGTRPGDEEWLDEPDFGAGVAVVPQAEAAPTESIPEFVTIQEGDFAQQVRVMPLDFKPLTYAQAAQIGDRINVIVPLDMQDWTPDNIDRVNDVVSECLTGSEVGLVDIGYSLCHAVNYGANMLALHVSASFDENWLNEAAAGASEDVLAQVAVLRFLNRSAFVRANPAEFDTPEAFMRAYGMERDAGEPMDSEQSWNQWFPKDPSTMGWEEAQDWVNAAVLADEATRGDQNWGNVWMDGAIDRYKAWHTAFLKHVKPLLN